MYDSYSIYFLAWSETYLGRTSYFFLLSRFSQKTITYYQSCSAVPSAFCSSASSVSVPHLTHNSLSRHIPFCNFSCQTSCRLCHRFSDTELNTSTLLQPPLLLPPPLPQHVFLNPFFTGPTTAANSVTPVLPEPLSLNRFVDSSGLPLEEFTDDDFHTELHPTLYPGAEIQLLGQNPQLLRPAEHNHNQLPYILVAGAQEDILSESVIAKHSPETLQLVLLNPTNSTSLPSLQSINNLSSFGQLLSTVPANLELVQMVRKWSLFAL